MNNKTARHNPTVEGLRAYRWIFGAAAVYNALWGSVICLFPNLFFDLIGLAHPNYPSLMQAIGMIVGVYALGYALIAREPIRFGPFVYVGLLGKILGPIGLVIAVLRGELPWSFFWLSLFNDLIWLPVFIPFAIGVYQRERKFKRPSD